MHAVLPHSPLHVRALAGRRTSGGRENGGGENGGGENDGSGGCSSPCLLADIDEHVEEGHVYDIIVKVSQAHQAVCLPDSVWGRGAG